MPDSSHNVPPIDGRKVFCIGLNKTGTSSFGHAMRRLGHRVFGWTGRSAEFTLNWHEGRLGEEVRKAITNNDAFEDLPWGLWYRELDRLVPDALFVLTERSSPAVWLQSIQGHIARGNPWVGHYLVYGSYDPVADAELYLSRYISHSAQVEAYFGDKPGKLLTVSWDKGGSWAELCGFLGIADIPDEPFPHINRAPASA